MGDVQIWERNVLVGARDEAPTGAGRFIPRKHKVGYKYLLGASLPLLFDVVLLFTSNPLPPTLFLSSLLSPPFHSCLRAALQKRLRREAGRSLGTPGQQKPPGQPPPVPCRGSIPAGGEGQDLCLVGVPTCLLWGQGLMDGGELRNSELKPRSQRTHGWLGSKGTVNYLGAQPAGICMVLRPVPCNYSAFADQPCFIPCSL